MFGLGKKADVASTNQQPMDTSKIEDCIRAAVQEAIKPLVAEIIRMKRQPSATPQISLAPSPVAKAVDGLDIEKQGNEIIATLYAKMPEPAPQKLRVFYTDLERETSVPISKRHKERLAGNEASVGKFPYRKVDTVLMMIDSDRVFRFAKSYEFTLK